MAISSRLLFAVGVAVAPNVAQAEDGPEAVARLVVVRHGAAARCPGGEDLTRRIDAVAGRAAVAPAGAPANVDLAISLEPSGGGFRAILAVTGARKGTRVIEDVSDTTCAAIGDAIAVSTVLLLDARDEPSVAAPPPPSAASSLPAAVAAPAPVAPPATAPSATGGTAPAREAPAPSPGLAWGSATAWSVDAAAMMTTFLSEAGSTEVGAWARRRVGPGSVGAGVRVAMPSEHRFANGAVDVWALRGAVEGCLDLVAGRTSTLSPCASVAVGGVLAEGTRFDETSGGSLPTVSLGGAVVSALGVGGPAAVLVRAGIAATPVRPAFFVEDLGGADPGEHGEAYRTPLVAADAGAGVRLAFD